MFLLPVMGLGSHNAFRYSWVWYVMFRCMAVVSLKKKADDLIREENEKSVDDTQDLYPSQQTAGECAVPLAG